MRRPLLLFTFLILLPPLILGHPGHPFDGPGGQALQAIFKQHLKNIGHAHAEQGTSRQHSPSEHGQGPAQTPPGPHALLGEQPRLSTLSGHSTNIDEIVAQVLSEHHSIPAPAPGHPPTPLAQGHPPTPPAQAHPPTPLAQQRDRPPSPPKHAQQRDRPPSPPKHAHQRDRPPSPPKHAHQRDRPPSPPKHAPAPAPRSPESPRPAPKLPPELERKRAREQLARERARERAARPPARPGPHADPRPPVDAETSRKLRQVWLPAYGELLFTYRAWQRALAEQQPGRVRFLSASLRPVLARYRQACGAVGLHDRAGVADLAYREGLIVPGSPSDKIVLFEHLDAHVAAT